MSRIEQSCNQAPLFLHRLVTGRSKSQTIFAQRLSIFSLQADFLLFGIQFNSAPLFGMPSFFFSSTMNTNKNHSHLM
jgi:hypothetical protein